VGLDLRIPVGALFGAYGLLLSTYGGVTLGQAGTTPTGVPINLVWGLVMLGFGLGMLALARRARRAPPRASHADEG
jgi:hypothetical protein